MNSKNIGNVGEAKALAKFVELGIPVYIPFGDNEKADLIAEFGGKLQKIQIKTSSTAEAGIVLFNISRSPYRKNRENLVYTKEDIDYFVLYSIVRDKLYLVEPTEKKVFTIRYDLTKNNQSKGISLEEDYLLDNVLQSMR